MSHWLVIPTRLLASKSSWLTGHRSATQAAGHQWGLLASSGGAGSSGSRAHSVRAAAPRPAQQASLPQPAALAQRWHAGAAAAAAAQPPPPSAAAAAAALPPLPSWEELAAQDAAVTARSANRHNAPAEDAAALAAALRRFQTSGEVRERARSIYVHKDLLPRASAAFRKFMVRAQTPGLAPAMAALQGDWGAASEVLWRYFERFVEVAFPTELDAYRRQIATLDLRSPHTWYPYARALQRRIVYHGGPTNSGKTHTALEALAAAPRGVYAGPLRLLAMEVYERLNLQGLKCSLVTGQEKQLVPGASHIACTVEMVPLTSHFDVAVVDEVQMIGDEGRGHAWTRALLGLGANEIHVAGDTSAVRLVRTLADDCGDEFELRTYERFTPLCVDGQGLPRGWADVLPGDCIVAFSRKGIYEIRREVEARTGLRCCVVYGSLPAETRRHQARLFNDPGSPYKVLIASDAIGMGLNFNIRRVVFSTMLKPMGAGRGGPRALAPVPASLVKQIAGRAGRRSSVYPEGWATCLAASDLPALEGALALPPEALRVAAAGLAPEYETLELLAAQMPGLGFDALVGTLAAEAQLDGTYFLCNQVELTAAARLLQRVPGLSLEDRYRFALAPLPSGDPLRRGEQALLEFAHTYAAGQPVLPPERPLPAAPPTTEAALAELEIAYKVLSLWLWLSFRFDDGAFPGRAAAMHAARRLCALLSAGLAATSGVRGGAAPPALTASATAAAAAAAPTPPPPPLEAQRQGTPPRAVEGAAARAAAAAGSPPPSPPPPTANEEPPTASAALRGDPPRAAPSPATAAPAAARAPPPPPLPPPSTPPPGSGDGVAPAAGGAPHATAGQEEEGAWVDPWLVGGAPPVEPSHATATQHPPHADAAAAALQPALAPLVSAFAEDDGGGGQALGDPGALLMPEWQPSMARFVRLKATSRLVVSAAPPPPLPAAAPGGGTDGAGAAGGGVGR